MVRLTTLTGCFDAILPTSSHPKKSLVRTMACTSLMHRHKVMTGIFFSLRRSWEPGKEEEGFCRAPQRRLDWHTVRRKPVRDLQRKATRVILTEAKFLQVWVRDFAQQNSKTPHGDILILNSTVSFILPYVEILWYGLFHYRFAVYLCLLWYITRGTIAKNHRKCI